MAIIFIILSSSSLLLSHCQSIDNHRRFKHDIELPPSTTIDTIDTNPVIPKIDPKELLQVKVINKSVNYYKTQLSRVRTSLQEQLKEFINGLKSIREQAQFGPELQEKMNDTFLKFIQDLEISPYCLASFNHLLLELKERRLWPLKCM